MRRNQTTPKRYGHGNTKMPRRELPAVSDRGIRFGDSIQHLLRFEVVGGPGI
ncbi:hypothetical protein D3C80_2147470 [compost metagenome]